MISEKHRVLAIDDDKDILELINITLGRQYDVVVLDDATYALETIEMSEPDLLILDIMMPKVTGYHILETLRKDPRTSFMPVIILSAKDSARDQKYGYKLGASIYLTKPFQPERLVKNVATMLGEVGFSHPRRKSLSMRDVNLRLQLHLSNLPTGATDLAAGEAHQQSGESGGFKLKRPLAQEQKKKEWLG
ncbi:hypothetical protein CVU37_03660 [candidate division BRC1 bacterium HGW-BRC1-1]|jgi:DNA-binding response OmpR family regulator|nr:MAG: hypothetical protein CVU37_03660 [candidate division BRC1 bacterium HGW-BRC1-1]